MVAEIVIKPSKIPKFIGVELYVFIASLGTKLTLVVDEAFYMFKACNSNLGLSEDICHNIQRPEYVEYNKQSQIVVSKFHQYNNVVDSGIPLILAFFWGSWSDRIGRLVPLLVGTSGHVLFSIMMLVNSLYGSWMLEVILFSVTLPCSLSGRELLCSAAAFAYLSDTTKPEQRTLRVSLLEAVYYAAVPVGLAIGSYLYSGPLYHSFSNIYAVSILFEVVAIVYVFIVIPWKSNVVRKDDGKICSLLNVRDTIKILYRPRKGRKRLILILCMLANMLANFEREERKMFQLYSIWKFHWDITDVSTFRVYESCLFIAGVGLGVPIMQKCFKLKDTHMLMVGTISHCVARVLFIFGSSPLWFYIGDAFIGFGVSTITMKRSMITKIVSSTEKGRACILFGISNNLIPPIGGNIYYQIYTTTLTTFPEAIFVLTIITQLVVLGMAIWIQVLGGNNITEDETEDINK